MPGPQVAEAAGKGGRAPAASVAQPASGSSGADVLSLGTAYFAVPAEPVHFESVKQAIAEAFSGKPGEADIAGFGPAGLQWRRS